MKKNILILSTIIVCTILGYYYFVISKQSNIESNNYSNYTIDKIKPQHIKCQSQYTSIGLNYYSEKKCQLLNMYAKDILIELKSDYFSIESTIEHIKHMLKLMPDINNIDIYNDKKKFRKDILSFSHNPKNSRRKIAYITYENENIKSIELAEQHRFGMSIRSLYVNKNICNKEKNIGDLKSCYQSFVNDIENISFEIKLMKIYEDKNNRFDFIFDIKIDTTNENSRNRIMNFLFFRLENTIHSGIGYPENVKFNDYICKNIDDNCREEYSYFFESNVIMCPSKDGHSMHSCSTYKGNCKFVDEDKIYCRNEVYNIRDKYYKFKIDYSKHTKNIYDYLKSRNMKQDSNIEDKLIKKALDNFKYLNIRFKVINIQKDNNTRSVNLELKIIKNYDSKLTRKELLKIEDFIYSTFGDIEEDSFAIYEDGSLSFTFDYVSFISQIDNSKFNENLQTYQKNLQILIDKINQKSVHLYKIKIDNITNIGHNATIKLHIVYLGYSKLDKVLRTFLFQIIYDFFGDISNIEVVRDLEYGPASKEYREDETKDIFDTNYQAGEYIIIKNRDFSKGLSNTKYQKELFEVIKYLYEYGSGDLHGKQLGKLHKFKNGNIINNRVIEIDNPRKLNFHLLGVKYKFEYLPHDYIESSNIDYGNGWEIDYLHGIFN